AVALPAGAEWVRAKVGGTTVTQIEELPGGTGYRIAFPERSDGGGKAPVLVELEYRIGSASSRGPWEAPRLLEGGVVEQALWEVRVPWGRAVVGVPSGWTDENTWSWEVYSFRRHPSRTTAALAAWVAGSAADSSVLEGLEDASASDVQ